MPLRSSFTNLRIDEEDEFVCACGHRTRDYLVKKKESPYYGQQFYACRKFIQDPTRCDTKIWFDEKERVRHLIPPAMRSPRTPRKQIDIRIFGQYIAPSTGKRKADTKIESFDSGVGDLDGPGEEPESPSALRSTKRLRNGYADAATQTGNNDSVKRSAAHAASRPSKPLPRRRLFDEFLTAPKHNSATRFDPFTPIADDTSTGLGPSVPLNRKPANASPLRTPTSLSENKTVSFSPGLSDGRPRAPPQESREPTTPPSRKGNAIGLITPSTSGYAHTLRRAPESDRPETPTPTKSTRSPQSLPQVTLDSTDTDDETYGWDEDLDDNILEIADKIENPGYSPLSL